MKFKRDVTVYVRKPMGNSIQWKKFDIRKALVTVTESANSNISAKAFVPNANIVVRFPKSAYFSLMPGDRIYISRSEELFPPSDSRSVLSVTGGDRGSRLLKLLKVVCG